MDMVADIYLSKLQQVQSILDSSAAKGGMEAPRFAGVLQNAVAQAPVAGAQQGGGGASYSSLISSAAQQNGLDENLIKAVISAESSYRSDAVSGAGAMGLMQLMPATASSLGVTDAFDPAQNIGGGAKYLKSLLDRFGDIRLALAAYNTGPSRIAALNITNPDDPAEYSKISGGVRGYVEKVLNKYGAYRAQGEAV